MARQDWWPGAMSAQRDKMQNIHDKIEAYQGDLALTPAQITAIQNLCLAFIAAYTWVEQCEQTSKAATAWRNAIFRGTPKGGPIDAAPVYQTAPVLTATLGVVDQLFDFRDQIVVNAGFTDAIGEDLGFLGTEITPEPEIEIAPNLKPAAEIGYKIRVAGSMQGMSQLRLEWRRAGTTVWQVITFLTNLPAEITITPNTPGQPESGELRGIFLLKNEEYGQYSPNFPLTLF